MRLLIVDNGDVYMYNGRFCVRQRNGEFLDEVCTCLPGACYVTTSHTSIDCSGLSTYPVEIPGLECVFLRVNSAKPLTKGLSYLRNLWTISSLAQRAHLAYLFFPGTLPSVFAILAILLRKRYGLYLRGSVNFRSFLTRFILSRAAFVLATGDNFVKLVSQYCRDVEPVVPMWNLPVGGANTRRELRGQGPWTLLYVGNVMERKGIPDLLEASRILLRRGVDFQLNLVGTNQMGIAAEQLGELAPRVHAVGPVTDPETLQRYYREADLFCFPSRLEGFPRVLYEAMASQLPIVTTFVGGIGGTMIDGYNCLRVNVNDGGHLAETIQRALSDVELRKRLSANGLETVMPIVRRASQETHATQLVRKARACLGRHSAMEEKGGAS